MDTVQRILTFVTCLTRLCLRSLNDRFVTWTKPDTTSLLLGTLIDLSRGKSELVTENALLRQQLIVLRRQVKRPVCTKMDRVLLVLLARMVRTWKQALFLVQPETLLRWHRQGFKLYWKYTSRAVSATVMATWHIRSRKRALGLLRPSAFSLLGGPQPSKEQVNSDHGPEKTGVSGQPTIREGMQRLQESSLKDLLRHDATSWMDLVYQLDDRTRGPASGCPLIVMVPPTYHWKSHHLVPCILSGRN
jgi:hypothetical protein